MRVLLYAEHCNPEMASEPGFVFRTVREIAERVDEAVVVTQIRNKATIDRCGIGRAQVAYIDTERIARRTQGLAHRLRLSAALGTLVALPQAYAFERGLRQRFAAALAAGRFDLIHRVGPVSPAFPSPVASWSPVPFVIGPVNGGLPFPPAFRDVLRKEREWLRLVRGGYRLLPHARATFRNAAAVLAAFRHTARSLPEVPAGRIFNIPEIGADPAEFSAPPRPADRERVRFLFVGRLVPFKCADVAVSAFARSAALRRHELSIVGDGPERAGLEALVRDSGLAGCVRFAGWRRPDEIAGLMQAADVFVFPSIRDSGAGVVAEAMMSGLPCVVVDYGPMGELVTAECGVKVPLGSRASHVEGFRTAMERLADTPGLRTALGRAARARAETRLSWGVRADKIVEIYRWVCGRGQTRPADLL